MPRIRPFRFSDLPVLARMLGAQWDLGRRHCGAGAVCNWIYALDILRESSIVTVILGDDNTPVGFAGVSQYHNPNPRWMRRVYNILYHGAWMLVKNQAALRAYYNAYDYTPDKIRRQFDAELSILILDARMRGTGLGRQLFTDIIRRAKHSGTRHLRIDTDDSCSVDFYRHCGCRPVFQGATAPADESGSENVYTFAKKL